MCPDIRSNPGHSLAGATEAVAAGCRFLREHQDADGFWRDYQLEPGRSGPWITGCVGYALTCCGKTETHAPALERAAGILHVSRRQEGWGYNDLTACDADSTAWVIRFLGQIGELRQIPVARLLSAFMTPSGAVCTFGSASRFGSWAWEHSEVAPLVGLALLAGDERLLAAQVRSAILRSWVPGCGWKPFWWKGDRYASAQSLAFLSQSGGIPHTIAADERTRLKRDHKPGSARETALCLIAAVNLEDADLSQRFGERLIEMRTKDGGWPSSPGLLVPSQVNPSDSQEFADDRQLLSTAMAVIALISWLSLSGRTE